MKKWIIYMYLALFTATTASAQWWKMGLGEKGAEQPQPSQRQMQYGQPGGRRSRLTDEQREKIREQHEAIMALAEAARNESDPTKKAELVGQLRAKLTEGAERMQAEFRRRLEKAEQGVAKMKKRLADAEKNRGQRIEEHLQKLLAGERPGPVPGRPEHRKQGASRGVPPPAL